MVRLRALNNSSQVASNGAGQSLIEHRRQEVKIQGLRAFCSSNPSIMTFLFAGICCNVFVVLLTWWLSRQIFECPAWATNCTIPASTVWIGRSLGFLQGFVTTIYSSGLACLAYAAHAMAEAAVWPLLTMQSFSLAELETYLATSRGSISSIPAALRLGKTKSAHKVLLLTVAITLSGLFAAPILGFIYSRRYEPITFESLYQPGGGQGRLFAQTNPPTSLLGEAFAEYASWSRKLSHEPLPEIRDWYVDRTALLKRGDMVVDAVQMKKNITCSNTLVYPNRDDAGSNNNIHEMEFHTSMAKHVPESHKGRHGETVKVRLLPQLAVWADRFTFHSATRTSALLIFAAVDGSIDDSTHASLPPWSTHVRDIAAVVCEIDIEFQDSTLTIGHPPSPFPSSNTKPLSSISSIHIGHPNSTTDPSLNTLNEVLLWFAMAPLLVGASVNGSQPGFYNSSTTNLPVPYTSTNSDNNNNWTAAGLEAFIHLAVGAVAQATSQSWRVLYEPVSIASWTPQRKLVPARVPLLLLLPAFTLACAAALAAWNDAAYRHLRIPAMRRAGLREVLAAWNGGDSDSDGDGDEADDGAYNGGTGDADNYDDAEFANDANDTNDINTERRTSTAHASRLGRRRLRYGIAPATGRAGLGEDVLPFSCVFSLLNNG